MGKETTPRQASESASNPSLSDRLWKAAKSLPPVMSTEEFRRLWDEKIWPDYVRRTQEADRSDGWKNDQQRPVPPEILHRKMDL